MTNLLLLICLTLIRASESNSVGLIENENVQKGEILDRSVITYQRRAEINRELVKSHTDIGSAASSIRNKKATNPLKNAEGNPFPAIRRGKVPNPLSAIDSRKFRKDPIHLEEAKSFPGIHRGKVPNPLFLDDRLTREVMDIYEDFVSHQSSIINEKQTSLNINAKDINQLTETITGSHLSGVVPQNSRNPLKRKDGGGSLHVLEDTTVPKKQRKAGKFERILPVDDKMMKKDLGIKKTSKKDWEYFFEKEDSLLDDEVMKSVIDEHIEQSPLEYDWKNWNFAAPHPSNPNINSAAGSARKMSQDSSIPIKKAIDTSRATRVFSKLPRFLQKANLEAQLKTPSNSPNSQKLANHNFDERSGSPLSKEDRALALKLLGESSSNSPAVQALSDAHLQNKPLSPPSKEDWEHVVELLKSESGAPTSPQNLPQERTLKRSFQLRQRQNKLAEDLEKLNAELKMPPGQTLERYFQLRQRQYKLAEEVEKLNAEFLSLPSAALINPGLSTTFSQKLLRSQIRERLFQLHQSQIQIAEIFEKLNSEFLSHSSTTLIHPFGLSAAVPQNLVLGQTFERLLQLRKIETQISEELGKLHADSFRLLSSAGPMNPSLSRAETNPLHRIHQEIVPGNPHLEISPLNFRNSPINSGSSHEQAMKNVLNNHQDQEPLGFNSISHTLQSSNHPTGGQSRKMFKDSSMSISKAISSDSSVGEEAAAKIFSKLPRLLK